MNNKLKKLIENKPLVLLISIIGMVFGWSMIPPCLLFAAENGMMYLPVFFAPVVLVGLSLILFGMTLIELVSDLVNSDGSTQ